MKTNVYVDGFNLYYRALKRTPYKWLNLDQLCRYLLPGHQINQIKYYTAHVAARPHDPDHKDYEQAVLITNDSDLVEPVVGTSGIIHQTDPQRCIERQPVS